MNLTSYRFLRFIKEDNNNKQSNKNIIYISLLLEGPNLKITKFPLCVEREDSEEMISILNSNEFLKGAILDRVQKKEVYTLSFKSQRNEEEFKMILPKINYDEPFNPAKHLNILKSSQSKEAQSKRLTESVNDIYRNYGSLTYWIISLSALLLGSSICLFLVFLFSLFH